MKWSHRLAYRVMRVWWSVRRPLTLGAFVVLVRGGEVLLVRTTYHRHWSLPGGGVKRGETLEQAARREASEEVGATLGELKLLGVYTSFQEGKSDHVTVFSCEDGDATLGGDHEIEEARWFPLEALPDGVAPGTARRVREFVEGRRPAFGPW
jgi:8-oxo-dGTP pyrophosphatase MutT (NUDIX family)